MYSLCGGFNNNCASCPSRASNWVCGRSVGSRYWTGYCAFFLICYPVSWNILVFRHYSLTIINMLIYQVLRFKLYPAAFLFYAAVVFAAAFVLICHFVPQYGQTHIMVYIGICSLVGSLSVCFSCLTVLSMWIHITILKKLGHKYSPVLSLICQVMSVKALGIALKVTFSGMNQLVYSQTWVFSFVVILCIVTQMNYLNKVRIYDQRYAHIQ
jgi:hypothetical protein